MIELTLRRYLQQFKALFPKKKINIISPSDLIKGEKARTYWKNNFGDNKMYIEWDFFCDHLKKRFPNIVEDNDFYEKLKFFINFPEDDIFTVYKFELLICLFGPINRFEENIKLCFSHSGFLGLINRLVLKDLALFFILK